MPGVPSWLNVRPNRGAAFAIHLTLSLLIFSSLVAVMLVYWFPGDLFIMDGGWAGLKLVALVDLVLGPALTLILFSPGKPGLKMDMSIIAAIQIAALAYGFYTTHNQRTVAIVYAENEFVTVSAQANEEANQILAKLKSEPKAIPKGGAFHVPLFLNPASDNPGEYIQSIFQGYPPAYERSDQYVALTDNHDKLQRGRKTKEVLEESGALDTVQQAVGKHQLTMDDVEVYGFRARYARGYVLYDPEAHRIIDYVRFGNQLETDQGETNQLKTDQGETNQLKTDQDETNQLKTDQDENNQLKTDQDENNQHETEQDDTDQLETEQDVTDQIAEHEDS
ncbi:MAG: hypothetical protein AB8B87_25760 [Granulosicoccus sp.]